MGNSTLRINAAMVWVGAIVVAGLLGCATDPHSRDPGLYYEGPSLEIAVGDTSEPLTFTKVTANARGQINIQEDYVLVTLHSEDESVAGIVGRSIVGLEADSTTIWAADRSGSFTTSRIPVKVTPLP